MKKIKVSGIIITLIMVFIGCEKAKDPAGQRNIAVIPVISDINPGIFDSKDLKNSYVEFKLGLESGKQVDKVVIEGSYNNNYERVNLAEVTSLPATVKIISGDVLQKLGMAQTEVANGDVFILEAVATAKGLTTRSNSILRVAVACAYDKTLAAGSYHSVSSDWNSEGNITITVDQADPYKLYVSGLEQIEGLNEDGGPLVMHINPGTYAVTADNTVIASDAWGYGSISYSGSGIYDSCNGSYIMHFEIALEALGSQGVFTFNFTRNAK